MRQFDQIRSLIRSIDWAQYETAYGNAGQDIPYYVPIGDGRGCTPKVKQSLLDLFSDDKQAAMHATHELWCGLCHQHAFLSSAALPAYDILFYGLQQLDDDLKVELLDIFLGFAVCTSQETLPGSWEGTIRAKLEQDRPFFLLLMSNENEEIAAFAEQIVEELPLQAGAPEQGETDERL